MPLFVNVLKMLSHSTEVCYYGLDRAGCGHICVQVFFVMLGDTPGQR